MNPAFNMFNNNIGMPSQMQGQQAPGQPQGNSQVFQMNPEAMVKNFLQSGQMSQQDFNSYMQQAQQIMQMIGR